MYIVGNGVLFAFEYRLSPEQLGKYTPNGPHVDW